MEKDRMEMIQRERDRLKVMSAVLEGTRTQVEAGRLLNLSVRQIRRIQRRLEAVGDVVETIARAEGLSAHAASVRVRRE